MYIQHPIAPSSNVLRQRVLCNKASSRGRLIGRNRFCAMSCNCTKQFCAISSYLFCAIRTRIKKSFAILYFQQKTVQVFAVCHMMGILSAIANPLLYGYFNQVCFLDANWASQTPTLIRWSVSLSIRNQDLSDMQKAASMASMLVLFFLPNCANVCAVDAQHLCKC